MVSRLSFATASWTGLQGQKHWQKKKRLEEFAKQMLCFGLRQS